MNKKILRKIKATATMNNIDFLFLLFLFFAAILHRSECQLDVLAISSYRQCIEVDPSAASSLNGVGNLLNCSAPIGQNSPIVTTIDLQVTPGLISDSSFIVNLTVVRDQGQQPSTTPQTCSPENAATQLCTVTEPARITVNTTKMRFRYELERLENFQIPYSYVSATEFIDAVNDRTQTDEDQCYNIPECYGAAIALCDPTTIELYPTALSAYCAALRQVLLSTATTGEGGFPDFYFWMRFNNMPNTTYTENFQGDNDLARKQQMMNNPLQCKIQETDGGPNEECETIAIYQVNNEEHQGNLLYFTNRYDDDNTLTGADRLCAMTPSKITGWLRRSFSLGSDNVTIDVRTGAFRPIPAPTSLIPNNIYQVNDLEIIPSLQDLAISTPFCPLDPVDVPFFTFANNPRLSGKSGDNIAVVECASPRCGANVDQRIDIFSLQQGKTCDNPDFDFVTKAHFTNSLHTIVATDPTCSVYNVSPQPQVLVEVDINVDILDGDGNVVSTQTITIDNLGVAGEATSSEEKLIRGRIESTQTINTKLGPSIDGYIVVCGRQGTGQDQFIDMRYLHPGDPSTSATINEDTSPLENPWPRLMENRKVVRGTNFNSCKCPADEDECKLSLTEPNTCCYPNWQFFFPHPSDYSPKGKFGKDDTINGLPNDAASSIWYFVSRDDGDREFGTGCNQVGMQTSWLLNSNNVQLMCSLPPHECVPGVGLNYNGGRKVTVPSNVASTFIKASGALRNGVTLQDPNEFFWQEDNPFHFLDTTLSEEIRKAQRFMPNDPYLADQDVFLYNPEKPNFWLSGPGYGLIFDPESSTNEGIISSSTLTSEVVIDLVGSFVGYTTNIAKARVIIDEIISGSGQQCISQEGTGNITLQIENQSVPPFGVSSNYRLTLDCRTSVTGISVATEEGDSNFYDVIQLAPNATSVPLIFLLSAEGTGTRYALPASELFCWANLTSLESTLDVNLDALKVNCGITPPEDNPYSVTISPNTTTTQESEQDCGTCWDWKCWFRIGQPFKSCVAYLIIIIPSLLGLAVLIMLIYVCVGYAKTKTTRIRETSEFNKWWKENTATNGKKSGKTNQKKK